jgi:hypothetical protein
MTYLEIRRVERDRRMQSAYSGPSPEVDQDTWVDARVLYQLILQEFKTHFACARSHSHFLSSPRAVNSSPSFS